MKKAFLCVCAVFLGASAAQAESVPAQKKLPNAEVSAAARENFFRRIVPARKIFSSAPTKLAGTRIFLVETVVDGVPAQMLVDTGASHTTLDSAWAKKTFPDARTESFVVGDASNVYSVPPQEIFFMPVGKFSVGENHFSDFIMPLADLRGLRAAMPELGDVAGILGMNTLSLAPFRLSLKNGTLRWLGEDEAARISDKKKLSARPLGGTDCVLLTVFSPKDGAALDALIDSGAVDTGVPADFWTGALPEKRHAVITTHAGTRRVEIEFGVPAPLKFSEDFSLENVSPKLAPAGTRGKILLGTDVLSRFDLVFDPRGNAVYAAPPE